MNWVLVIAIFFILWWVVLFAVLPFSMRTQDEEADVTLGTVKSAPRGPHMLRAVIRTSLVTIILFVIWYAAVMLFDIGFDQIPRIVPKFD